MITDGFDSPFGSRLERQSADVPAGNWRETFGFGYWYLLLNSPSYHCGIDVNLWPGGGLGQPIYAPAHGTVTYARHVASSWRNLLIIRHDLPDGTALYSRYGHLLDFAVVEGQTVRRGELVAHLGNADGLFFPHVHLDFSPTAVLATYPAYWPGMDRAGLTANFIDPFVYIRSNRPMTTTLDVLLEIQTQQTLITDLLTRAIAAESEPPPPPPPDPIDTPRQAQVTADPEMRIRDKPASSGAIVGYLPFKTVVMVIDVDTSSAPDGLTWCKITEGDWKDRFLAKNWLSFQ